MQDQHEKRPEQIIFDDLAALCASPGYAHAIAYFSYRDNVLRYSGELRPEDMEKFYSHESLIRTEISTLIGLLVKSPVDVTLPSPETIDGYLVKTEALLQEIHDALIDLMFAGFDPRTAAAGGFKPLSTGAGMREPIFYGGESAYSFQYRDLAPQKYSKDADWLRATKGFSIDQAREVIRAIAIVQERQLRQTLDAMAETASHERTVLPAFTFTAGAIADQAGMDAGLTEKVLNAFSIPHGSRNEGFLTLADFNVANAYPLIPTRTGEFILFQYYSLLEALYETPFYWTLEDKAYAPTALKHRGEFTEEYSTQRLELVFGKEHVYSNVHIVGPRGKEPGEIDVLVTFGDRAIVLQAKSKRLTQEAKKGNDGRIKDDFTKSVQDAYDQGTKCAGLLTEPGYEFRDGHSQQVRPPKPLKEIYLLCVVADHYPALAYQVREFLTYKATGPIQPPLVLDVFALDAITEMLSTPLQFLSYIKRRTGYTEKLFSGHELTILSYHLKKNLWIKDDLTSVTLGDDIATDLDIAMNVRRERLPGQATPDGVLTRFPATTLGRIVERIETKPDPATISLGFALLALGEDAVRQASNHIDRIIKLARRDGKPHDFAAGIGNRMGIAVHCNDDPFELATRRLEYHCQKRKYLEKADAWFGTCLSPQDGAIRFGVSLEFPWKADADMEAMIAGIEGSMREASKKVGRNDRCPCGSGKKYKKCCLND
jgi:hypothetical protein